MFLECLRETEVRMWRELRDDGVVSAANVFEVAAVQHSEPGVPPWNFVFLIRLRPGVAPEVFFEGERTGADAVPGKVRCRDVGAVTRRVEVLRATPRSCHPGSFSILDTRDNTPYTIEYIAVNESPAALAEYRETMRTTIGPALGELVRARQLVNMFALETVSVEASQPGMPGWNQVHIRGYFPEIGAKPATMDAAIRRANPESAGAKAVFARLDAIRVKRREDLTHDLYDLAVR